MLFWWKRSAVSWPALVMLPVHCSGRIEEEEEEEKASHSRQNMSYSPECAEKMRHNHTVEEVLIIY